MTIILFIELPFSCLSHGNQCSYPPAHLRLGIGLSRLEDGTSRMRLDCMGIRHHDQNLGNYIKYRKSSSISNRVYCIKYIKYIKYILRSNSILYIKQLMKIGVYHGLSKER